MSNRFIPPQLGAESFSCPHCGAFAHQTWYTSFLKYVGKDQKPVTWTAGDINNLESEDLSEELRERFRKLKDRLEKNIVTYDARKTAEYLYSEVLNVFLSECFSCKGFAIWVEDRLIYPVTASEIRKPDDLPADLVRDYEEAASIVDLSPRGAAAILRLLIQKLMPVLEVEEDDLNKAIGALVKRGLDSKIQKALDVLRVIGNNAVHPGQIVLDDDKATALKLFALVDLIVVSMISNKKQLDDLYENLPTGALEGIKRRDKKDEGGGS
ncbi:MAG: DUF4145 domain-containing protein [Xanthobacteraceae bacterium]|nr:DUF4145 domain-containing protein [Xanthobacteraceae bacterium]QYK46394.1 MAG: DUF4145 domain-containing protein [Xanthobacteraceae bacterium]